MMAGEVLQNSLDLQSIPRSDIESSDQRSVCEQLSSPYILYDVEKASEFSKVLGFDTRRLVAAHNIFVASKAADSASLATLASLCENLVPNEHFDDFVRAVCEANAELNLTKFDSISGYVHFRECVLRNKQWTDSVLRNL